MTGTNLPDDAITLAQASQILGIDVSRLRKLAARGVLKARKIGRDWITTRFDRRFEKAIVKEMRRNEEFSVALLNDEAMRQRVAQGISADVYTRSRVAWQRECPIGDLLARGEDQYLEFKSTLEWDTRLEKANKALRTATLKTIAAFLNSPFGGTAVIGVADDGSIVGLEGDYSVIHHEGKDDADWFQLHLSQLVESSMGLAAATCATTQIHHVDDHDICRVHVEPSTHPVSAKVLEVNRRGQQQTDLDSETAQDQLDHGTGPQPVPGVGGCFHDPARPALLHTSPTMDNESVATVRAPRARPLTMTRLRARRPAILRVLGRHGLANPRVFGSVASGEASDRSDLDLAVDWAPGRRPRGFAYYSAVADAQRELTELLGVPVDIVPVEQAKPRLAAAIEREAPPL